MHSFIIAFITFIIYEPQWYGVLNTKITYKKIKDRARLYTDQARVKFYFYLYYPISWEKDECTFLRFEFAFAVEKL